MARGCERPQGQRTQLWESGGGGRVEVSRSQSPDEEEARRQCRWLAAGRGGRPDVRDKGQEAREACRCPCPLEDAVHPATGLWSRTGTAAPTLLPRPKPDQLRPPVGGDGLPAAGLPCGLPPRELPWRLPSCDALRRGWRSGHHALGPPGSSRPCSDISTVGSAKGPCAQQGPSGAAPGGGSVHVESRYIHGAVMRRPVGPE